MILPYQDSVSVALNMFCISQLIQNDPGYKNIDENAYRMMEVHGSLKGYKIMVEDYRTEKGGVDMCKAWDDWREDGRKEGIREERINTERERKNAEKERQNAEKERQNAEKERQNAEEERRKTEKALKRAEKAEAEIIRLKALLAEVRAQA